MLEAETRSALTLEGRTLRSLPPDELAAYQARLKRLH
jgi:hypothetical protein